MPCGYPSGVAGLYGLSAGFCWPTAPGFWYPQDIEYLALPVLVFMVNGVGLPDDYAERGRGFDGMRADAEQMGGRLIVESGEGGGGTTITCVVPKEGNEGGC